MSRPDLDKTRLAVVLPILNEAAILPSLVSKVVSALQSLDCQWKIVFVNDGSTDASRQIVDDLCEHDSRFVGIHFSRNFGHQAAILAGLDHCKADAVILMDSDGQDDPLAIPQFFYAWQSGYDVVYATRASRQEGRLMRGAFKAFYWLLSKLATHSIPREAGNFGIVDFRVVEHIRNMPERDRYFPGLRAWVGFRQTSIAVPRLRRHDRFARVGIWGLVALAKNAVFGFSRVPLNAFYWIASLAGIASLACTGFALYHKLFTGLAIPGWASITSVVSFFGAMNALGIAILGEYIARIYDQVRGRPPYVVADVVSQNVRQTNSNEFAQILADLNALTQLQSEITGARSLDVTIQNRTSNSYAVDDNRNAADRILSVKSKVSK
ncbi:MAG: glycosyltransferase family 2 protein [Planctomycetales bacterium]|nr:glycosyltransferase family 2 protein [Planctomycetales bacterium]